MSVYDNCTAIDLVMHYGELGNIYNIGAGNEVKNIDLVKKILSMMNKPETLIKFVTDRPGHDLKYSINTNKIGALGWKPSVDFSTGLNDTIEYYRRKYAY